MKKYLLFTFNNYYPRGGFEDYVSSFDTIEDAYNTWLNIPVIDRDANCQIVDYTTLKIVQEYNI